jgi:hypothetical protein
MMVTRSQIDRLGNRIEQLSVTMGLAGIEYEVYLSYYDESEDDFHARYPEAPRPMVFDAVLSFEDAPMLRRSD